MDCIVQDHHAAEPEGFARPATMDDVLDVIARSRYSLLVIGLPETTVIAVSDVAAELFGVDTEMLVGRRATSLCRGGNSSCKTCRSLSN